MSSSLPAEHLVVLVADDDEEMRTLVAATLREDGCSTLEARDGQELLDLLGEALDEPGLRPDVVVTDLKMPRLSGLGVLGFDAGAVAIAGRDDDGRVRRVHPRGRHAAGGGRGTAQALPARRSPCGRSQRKSCARAEAVSVLQRAIQLWRVRCHRDDLPRLPTRCGEPRKRRGVTLVGRLLGRSA